MIFCLLLWTTKPFQNGTYPYRKGFILSKANSLLLDLSPVAKKGTERWERAGGCIKRNW